jgi:hypothetical protein
MGNAVPTRATAIAPAMRYVVPSAETSPTADTATSRDCSFLPWIGKVAKVGFDWFLHAAPSVHGKRIDEDDTEEEVNAILTTNKGFLLCSLFFFSLYVCRE